MPADRCPAEVIQHDDRWGGIRDRCELDAGHDGSHRASRDACEPKAWLTWDAPPPDPWEGLADAMRRAFDETFDVPYSTESDRCLACLRAALDWLREHPEAGLPGGLEFNGGGPHYHLFLLRKDGDR